MQLFHIQHELIYEREREKGNGTTNEKRGTQKDTEREKEHRERKYEFKRIDSQGI